MKESDLPPLPISAMMVSKSGKYFDAFSPVQMRQYGLKAYQLGKRAETMSIKVITRPIIAEILNIRRDEIAMLYAYAKAIRDAPFSKPEKIEDENKPPRPEYYTTVEVAKMFRVRRSTPRESLSRKGQWMGIKPVKLPSGRILWPSSEIDRVLNKEK